MPWFRDTTFPYALYFCTYCISHSSLIFPVRCLSVVVCQVWLLTLLVDRLELRG
jgi:hypothetical protein